MERHGVQIGGYEQERTTAEAAVATIHKAGGELLRTQMPPAADSQITIKIISDAHNPVTDVVIKNISSEMLAVLDRIVNILDSKSCCVRGKTVQEALAITFSAGPAANRSAKQVMFGVCGGQKEQEGISNRIGQYDPLEADVLGADKALLMQEINTYIALAEEQAKLQQPDHFAKMARLHMILSKHCVFNQDACAMQSRIWTNGYVSVGARAIGRHTDYRNPTLTHLTTQQLGNWMGVTLTGQTVVLNRFGTKALVVEDSPGGLQWIGGLHGVAHANFGPEM